MPAAAAALREGGDVGALRYTSICRRYIALRARLGIRDSLEVRACNHERLHALQVALQQPFARLRESWNASCKTLCGCPVGRQKFDPLAVSVSNAQGKVGWIVRN